MIANKTDTTLAEQMYRAWLTDGGRETVHDLVVRTTEAAFLKVHSVCKCNDCAAAVEALSHG